MCVKMNRVILSENGVDDYTSINWAEFLPPPGICRAS